MEKREWRKDKGEDTEEPLLVTAVVFIMIGRERANTSLSSLFNLFLFFNFIFFLYIKSFLMILISKNSKKIP